MSKKRTLTVASRLDARTLLVLMEALPKGVEKTISSCTRFFLEVSADTLVDKGVVKFTESIEEAVDKLHKHGLQLAQLDSTNRNARRTINAINKEKVSALLSSPEEKTSPQIRAEVAEALEVMHANARKGT